jgi:hypothetical protein
MRTYYRGPDVLITREAFVRRTAPQRIFVIRDLHHVVMVRGELDPARSTTAHVAGGALVLVAASWPMLDKPATFAAAALVIALPSMAGIACWRMRPRRWELRAGYQGHEVILYASADITTFNQVSRGLRRAIEDATPPASYYELAGG